MPGKATRKTDGTSEEFRAQEAETTLSARWVDVVPSLFDDAQRGIQKTGQVDDVWLDSAGGVLVQVLLDGDADTLSWIERALSRVDAQIYALADADHPGSPADGADATQRGAALAQLRLLRHLAQLGADAVAPREVAADIEPGTHAARLLSLLANSEDEVFSDVIVAELDLHPTQLSQLYKRLGPDVLERRKYGRRVSWALTSTGDAVAALLRERALDPAPDVREKAASPEEFEDAVHREVGAIEIDRPLGEDNWYLRATYPRLSGTDLFGDAPLPYFVFPSSSDDAAYLRGDFARRFLEYLHTGPGSTLSRGLSLVEGLTDPDGDDETPKNKELADAV